MIKNWKIDSYWIVTTGGLLPEIDSPKIICMWLLLVKMLGLLLVDETEEGRGEVNLSVTLTVMVRSGSTLDVRWGTGSGLIRSPVTLSGCLSKLSRDEWQWLSGRPFDCKISLADREESSRCQIGSKEQSSCKRLCREFLIVEKTLHWYFYRNRYFWLYAITYNMFK